MTSATTASTGSRRCSQRWKRPPARSSVPAMRVLLLAIACVFAAASFTPAQTTRKKLIEFGWDEPDPAFMRKHIAEMEKSPFDGTVFHINTDFLWQCWSKRAFTEAELQPA